MIKSLVSHPRLNYYLERYGALGVALLILLGFYIPTLQTIINGSSDLKMIDVGETQAVLNTWGTLHATGYPHYVISGNIIVALLKWFGVNPITATSLVSLVWGMLALIILYSLIYRLTYHALIAAGVVLLYGMTRFVWLHQVIAEIYSFTLFILLLLFWIAFSWRRMPRRIIWLALIGGIGIAHHRTIALAIPALVWAVFPQFFYQLRTQPRRFVLWLAVGFIGFVPYIYLPWRENSNDNAWVYGEPNTWDGFWDQFSGTEAGYLFGLPKSQAALQANFERINHLMVDELSLVGIVVGILGLTITWVIKPTHRRFVVALALLVSVNYIFAVCFYFDILASIILAITFGLVMGWVLFFYHIYEWLYEKALGPIFYLFFGFILIGYGLRLNDANAIFIYNLTHDRTGLETVALVENAPPNSTVMLAWGPRYFAVGVAQDALGDLNDIHRTDHKGDYQAILQNERLVTPWYTFFAQPYPWWQARLGNSVYLQSPAPEIVEITTKPRLIPLWQLKFMRWVVPENPIAPVMLWEQAVRCNKETIVLEVTWLALHKPSHDLSVFVHLVHQVGQPPLLAQGDKPDPVYGWRPLSTWLAGELVMDTYVIPRHPQGHYMQYGFYDKINWWQRYSEQAIEAKCP